MSTPRDEALKMVRVLESAEEALAALDQLAGSEHEVQREARTAYQRIITARDRSIDEWNAAEIYQVGRCVKAAGVDYYTAVDGPCDVWDLVQDGFEDAKGEFWCSGCSTAEAEKYEAYKESL